MWSTHYRAHLGPTQNEEMPTYCTSEVETNLWSWWKVLWYNFGHRTVEKGDTFFVIHGGITVTSLRSKSLIFTHIFWSCSITIRGSHIGPLHDRNSNVTMRKRWASAILKRWDKITPILDQCSIWKYKTETILILRNCCHFGLSHAMPCQPVTYSMAKSG